MGGHEHGLAARGRQIDQHGGDDLGVVGIQIARGLIGEDDRGIIDQSKAHRHALLLAARKLLGPFEALGLQAHGLQQAFSARASLLRRHPRQQHGQLEIFDGREAGDQVEELEDKADLAQAIKLELALGHARHILAIDPDLAAARPVHAAQQIEDRGLAAARWAHQRGGFPAADGPVHLFQRDDAGRLRFIGLRHADQAHRAVGLGGLVRHSLLASVGVTARDYGLK